MLKVVRRFYLLHLTLSLTKSIVICVIDVDYDSHAGNNSYSNFVRVSSLNQDSTQSVDTEDRLLISKVPFEQVRIYELLGKGGR
jgi:hypothetical protein